MSHRPKGLPDGGQYDGKAGVGGDTDLAGPGVAGLVPERVEHWRRALADLGLDEAAARRLWARRLPKDEGGLSWRSGLSVIVAGPVGDRYPEETMEDMGLMSGEIERFRNLTGADISVSLSDGLISVHRDGIVWSLDRVGGRYGRAPVGVGANPVAYLEYSRRWTDRGGDLLHDMGVTGQAAESLDRLQNIVVRCRNRLDRPVEGTPDNPAGIIRVGENRWTSPGQGVVIRTPRDGGTEADLKESIRLAGTLRMHTGLDIHVDLDSGTVTLRDDEYRWQANPRVHWLERTPVDDENPETYAKRRDWDDQTIRDGDGRVIVRADDRRGMWMEGDHPGLDAWVADIRRAGVDGWGWEKGDTGTLYRLVSVAARHRKRAGGWGEEADRVLR